MLRERKRVLSTNLFAFDSNGKKVQLSATDFGSTRQERMGSQVKGLGAPPPTQFIQIPQHLLSPDQVLIEMVQEKRTLAWQLRVIWGLVKAFIHRYARVVERHLRRARIEVTRAIGRLRDHVRRTRMKDSWGFDDFTEIAEAPPEFRPKSRRPSIV
jgi:hypothetical protein